MHRRVQRQTVLHAQRQQTTSGGSVVFEQGTAATKNTTSVGRPEYVAEKSDWDRLHHIFVILWPGLCLVELMRVMEEDYNFRAT